jgi:hypothetical protein
MPAISEYSLFGRLREITQKQPRLEIGKGTMSFLGLPAYGRSLKYKKHYHHH